MLLLLKISANVVRYAYKTVQLCLLAMAVLLVLTIVGLCCFDFMLYAYRYFTYPISGKKTNESNPKLDIEALSEKNNAKKD